MALGAPLDQHTRETNELENTQGYQTALYSLFVLFFMMGFITCLNDILLPYLKKVFDLTYTQASLIQFSFFSAYAIMSIPSSMVIRKIGYKATMIAGFSVAAAGCLLFLPAVSFHSYGIFLFALFVLATGIVLLQVAGNPYVSILGSSETASARLTLAQALNSVGTFLAPHFGAFFILSKLKDTTDASAVEVPYIGLAVTLIVIAFILSRITLPTVQTGGNTSEESTEGSAWNYSHLVFGVIGIFMYVGGEVAIGSYLINYLGQPEIAGLTEETGAAFVSYYWGGAMVGRFVGTWLLSQFQPSKVLMTFALAAVAMIALSISTTGAIAMWSIILVGFFNSIMFPTIFTLAVKGLGKHTAQASGFLSTAIVGGAFIPFLFGMCVDSFKESSGDEAYALRIAFLIPIVCYVYIAWYGASGSKVKNS